VHDEGPPELPHGWIEGGYARGGGMVIGEAPRREEERLRRPFVGPAGMCLRGAFVLEGLDAEQLWLTNVVKVRPGGRNPNRTEIDNGRDYLGEEIRHVAPTCILALWNRLQDADRRNTLDGRCP
jgi:uracil-DNA glycosylase family 4